VALEDGPLVYALAIKEKWTPKVEERFTTAEFPSWEATPESEWRYGLALDPAKLASQIEVRRNPVDADHAVDLWENPPVSLTAPVRRIEDWELQTNPEDASQKFTPPLPDLSASKVSETTERITLVPYGSTQLRVTIFPAVRA